LLVGEFLKRKGVRVVSLSPFFGYSLLDYQYEFLQGGFASDKVLSDLRGELEAAKPEAV